MERATPDLSFLLDKASEALATRMSAALADLDLTVRQYCVLAKASSGDRTQGQIAQEALLDKTTMVVTLDNLESSGLAERVACPRDRRARIVRTTDDGEALLEEATALIQQLYDEVLGGLDPRRRAALVEGLEALVGTGGPLHAPPVDVRPRRSSRAG